MPLHFAQPFWIVAGLITCTLALVFLRAIAVKRRQALARFAAPKIAGRLTTNVSTVRRRSKDTLFVFALFCCFLTLARPQYGDEWIEVRQKGIDILIAVDTSRSMSARDIQPNRLERAKLAIKDFVAVLEGDRIGLMPFAGTSFLMCPLTTDYAAFTTSLDTIGPNTIPKGGTDLAGVISAADNILEGETNHKILILVTDGEDLEGAALQAAQKTAQQNMTIYTVGVGTSEGELIPNVEGSRGTFIKDESGNFVRSRLDETTLKKIADITDGLYVPLGNMGQGFTTIYQQKLTLVPKEEHHERMQRHPIERFYWPLALAIMLLTVEYLLSERKSSRSFGIPLIKTAGRRLFNKPKLPIVLLVLLCGFPRYSNGSTGDELYHAGKFDQAEQEYTKDLKKDPDKATLHFNLGDAQYKTNAYEKAISSFSRALQSDDLDLQAKSYFNLGNAQYQLGKTTLQTDPEHTIELYQQAISAYEGSLALNPDDTDATYNRDLVKNELEELKKQQQEKQQQEQKKQQNKEDQDKEKSDKNSQQQQDSEQEQQEKNKTEQGPEQKNQEQKGQPSEDKKTQQNSTDNDPQEIKPNSDNPQETAEQKEQAQKNAGENSNSPDKTTEKAGGMSKADKERRQQGKMTLEEAKNLLDALEGEEGRLDFVPQGTTGNAKEQPLRDW